jgi:PIN domain nuclease of toxin-antitoxin system
MNLLLDRPVLLWWLNGHPTLSRKAKAAIADGKTLVLVSAVVIWEIRIMDDPHHENTSVNRKSYKRIKIK